MTMDFGSLQRTASARSKENRKKTFSISNISFTSGNSSTTTVVRKSLSITLPRDLGIQQDVNGRISLVSKGGSAHLSGVIQIGDLVNVFPDNLSELRHSPAEECPLTMNDDEFVNVNIIYGILQVESRPLCPLMVEIGNRNNTSIGLALADSPGEKIRISSIQPGSLAERCGYLKPGDILMSIQVTENETLSCSPYYTSYETAQIIRGITNSMPSVTLSILPYEAEQLQLQKQHISLFNMLSSTAGNNVKFKNEFGSEATLIPECGQSENTNKNTCNDGNNHFQHDLEDENDNDAMVNGDNLNGELEDYSILSFSLWKDRLYEDWGFSLTDSAESNQRLQHNKNQDFHCSSSATSSKSKKTLDSCPEGSKANATRFECIQEAGSEILQIRPGGPAFAARLQPGDRIAQINGQDVLNLESTMLVPMLASLEDSLNLTVIRTNKKTSPS